MARSLKKGPFVALSLEKKVQKKFQQSVFRAVNMVRNTVIEGISAGGQGEVYEKYNPRRTHQASLEGAYPATDTGYLISHINSKVYSRIKVIINDKKEIIKEIRIII